jgi:hypothetical protein
MPPNLHEITAALTELSAQVEDRPVTGSYLLAGSYDVLFHKRNVDGQPVLKIDDEGFEEYPIVGEALHKPYALVQLNEQDRSGLGEILNDDVRSIEVNYIGERFALLLLSGKD